MAGKLRKLTKRILVILNIILVVCYLLVCLVPFLNAGKYWFIAIIGLGFPVLFFFVLGLGIFWSVARSRWFLLSLIAIVVSWQQISSSFALRIGKRFNEEKPRQSIRILSWNVSRWNELRDIRKGHSYRNDMIKLINAQQADILCFQEFFESKAPKFFKSNISTLDSLGFHYSYFAPTFSWWENNFKSGVVIFSRYPIVDSAHFSFGKKTAAESLIYADVMVQNHRVRIFTTHLQSVLFDKRDYQGITRIKNTEDSALEASRTIVAKLKRAYQYRSEQAEVVRQHLDASPYPVILCGDFNDVPNSYTYFTIKGNRQDAFLQKGSGIGRTFRFISPTLRIDYILADKKFTIQQYTRLKVPYSDHYPVMADLTFK